MAERTAVCPSGKIDGRQREFDHSASMLALEIISLLSRGSRKHGLTNFTWKSKAGEPRALVKAERALLHHAQVGKDTCGV